MSIRRKILRNWFTAYLALCSPQAWAAEEISIWYIEREIERPPTLSNLAPMEPDIGLQGAELGIADSNTTGKFLGQVYELSSHVLEPEEDLLALVPKIEKTSNLIIAHLPADNLLKLAKAMPDALIFNASSADNALRNDECRANVMHTMPSRAMLADALAQFLLKKKWGNWLLLTGPTDADKAFGQALRDAARKFGSKIVQDTAWDSKTDLQRDAYQEISRLTNRSGHDVIVVADEVGDFSRFLPYNTYHPRPVVGSEGLVAAGWAPVVEQWGAAQLQKRFKEQANRPMREVDYAAWTAVRSISEAVTRTKKTDAGAIRAYLLSDKFQLAAFKGRKMSYRDWNGQLRQPIPLVHSRALVTLAPLEGYLHPVTELDTLGFDRPESSCEAFSQ